MVWAKQSKLIKNSGSFSNSTIVLLLLLHINDVMKQLKNQLPHWEYFAIPYERIC